MFQNHHQNLFSASLIGSLSQSLSESMVQQACLLNLLVKHTMLRQQSQASNQRNSESHSPPLKLAMGLKECEIKARKNNEALPSVDVSGGGIMCKEFNPHETK